MISYHNRRFSPVSNSDNGEVDQAMIFEYMQEGNILTCTYRGNQIRYGHLIGLVDDDGVINMRYHQVNAQGKLMTGTCTSTPEILPNGNIRLHESWQWTSGDMSSGESILEEI